MKNKRFEKLLVFLLIFALVFPLFAVVEPSLAAGSPVMKTFDQLTEAEKELVLTSLISDRVVSARVTVDGGSYPLNESLWYEKGIIAYGNTASVNSNHQTGSSPNYKNGQYRYWGYDMNGGLYGNDDFPRDSDSGTPAYNKAWLTLQQIRNNSTASGYVGSFALTDRFTTSQKRATAEAFLDENPQWEASGKDVDYLLSHFFFNSVLDDRGLAHGQFIGVHKSVYNGRYYYQTFSVMGEIAWFEIPTEEPVIPEDPNPEEPVIPEPEPGADVSATVSLSVPNVTYVGHPTIAEDFSSFLVDGEMYSALAAYSEGFASNSFSADDASTRKISDTRARMTFSSPGNKSVKLTVRPKGGTPLTDTKMIEVKKTPTILYNLTGPLKQNRKNTLYVKVAKDPSASLTQFWIKIEHPETEESVTLQHNFSGTNTLVNGGTIKTRPIVAGESDDFFFNCSLEFLTKNTENTDYVITIYTKDSKGNTDQITEEVAISSDKAPDVAVLLQSYYIRGQDSNIAEIITEDGTVTDGDQIERTWYYRSGGDTDWIAIAGTSGYSDYSFGTGKKVGFMKEGVGPLEVRLVARDLWVEDTMPEYVLPSDRLSSEAVGSCEVINVAPVVSLDPISARTAEINILTGSEAEYNRVNANLAQLKQSLLREGLSAHITVDRMPKSEIVPSSPAAKKLSEVDTPFGFDGGWMFYEDQNFAIDNKNIYKISATWAGEGYDALPVDPYTIGAWDAITGLPVWSYTFTSSVLAVPTGRDGPYFAQDDCEKYLFFVASGKTLILTKDTGSFLTVLNMEVGKYCAAEGDKIFTFKSDGIYSISTLTGQVKKVYNGTVMGGEVRKLGGKIHFVAHQGNVMHRGIFDTETETVSLEALPAQYYGLGLASHTVLGIDTEGKLLILTNLRIRYASGEFTGGYAKTIRVYDRKNAMIYCSPVHPDDDGSVNGIAPVYDESGVCNYFAFTWDTKSSSYRYTHARIHGIYDGLTLSHYIRLEGDDYPSNADSIPFVREIGGQIYIASGAIFIYVYNSGTNIYRERCKVFAFNPSTGTAREAEISEVGIPLATIEYGLQSDVFAVVQTGNNWPGLTNGSESHVLAWNQPASSIVNNYAERSLKAGKDLNALIVYDETNPAGTYTTALLNALNAKASAKNAKFILATRADIEGTGLGEALLSLGDEDQNLLGVSVDPGKVGSLSKSFALEPNETYYYEYEIKKTGGVAGDVLQASHNAVNPSGAQFLSTGYRTVASHRDDFEDAENTNPFFNYASVEVSRYSGMEKVISEGYYKGADLRYKRSSGNGYYADPYQPATTAITFTVPEGKQGFLSFDYLLEKGNAYGGGNSAWTQSYVKIDGKLWDACVPNSSTGHYSHPDLLQPGAHVITFYASEYGREITAKMWLDWIRVDLLEEDANTQLPPAEKQTTSTESFADGYTKVKGQLETLPQIATYGQVQNVEVIDGAIGSANYTVWTNTDEDRRAFDFNIPTGKTAIFTQVSTLSNPVWRNDRNEAVTYKLPLYYMDKEDGWINHSWTALAQNRYAQDAMRNWDNNGTIIPGELEGTKSFSLSASSYRGSRGNFTNISSVIADTSRKSWGNLDFFLTGSGSSRKFLLQKDEYIGANISLQFAEGDYSIRNFKLYSIRNGVRVYAADEPFSDSAKFSEWNIAQATASIIKAAVPEPEEQGMVYKRGQPILYAIYSYDYEWDPTKKEYWKYTHTPFIEGGEQHPLAATILDKNGNPIKITGTVLNAPIATADIEGKYYVEHWIEDNSTRTDSPAGSPYDKLSNVEMLTFYVEGGEAAPIVKSIQTIPAIVGEGDDFRFQIQIDDNEKDPLDLLAELYFNRRLVYAYGRDNILANASGVYPTITTDMVPFKAEKGAYEMVVTVTDDVSAGVGSLRFRVRPPVEGYIHHTTQWNKNRIQYNLAKPTNKTDSPRDYGTFWAGERFLIEAFVADNPMSVDVEIVGHPEYKTTMTPVGVYNEDGSELYTATLWDSNMVNQWGNTVPEILEFRFTAKYGAPLNLNRIKDISIVVDNREPFWRAQRKY